MNLSEAEVRDYLGRDEGLYLDFKSLWDRSSSEPKLRDRREVRDQIAKYVAAFANAEGGVLILGVDPDEHAPSGHDYPGDAVDEFARVPRTRLESELKVEMQRITIDGHELLIFDVTEHPEAVMVKGDGFPLRVQDSVVLESQERINARKQAVRGVAFEEIIRPDATLGDLDLDLAAEYFRSTPHASRPVEKTLERYRLVHDTPRGPRVTNAALLLFARDTGRWHNRAGVRLFRVTGTARRYGEKRNVAQFPRIESPLARIIKEAHERCSAQIRKSEKLHDLFFREFAEYPKFAWQEAIVNAVAHRDYRDRGREIEVWFFDDRMEVSSPGELVQPITLDALRSRKGLHVSRNPLIVRVLADAGVMREEGEGFPRMFDEMEASFLKLPELTQEGGLFRVALFNTPILDAGNPEWQAIVERLPIGTAQKRVLVANPGGFRSRDYQKLNNVDRDQAYSEIQDLIAQGIVVATGGRGRGAEYRVSPDLRSDRLWLEERLPGIREHLSASETLTNTGYRDLFDVGRYRAVHDLQKLCELGVLERRGTKRGAHYVAGPRLRRKT